jgi:transposase-like protein
MSKALIGVGRHERTGDRLNYRNGYRERSLDTRLGSLQLRIPKLRQGHLRNALAHVPKPAHHGRRRDAASLPAGRCQGRVQTWRHVADQLRARWPKLATLIDDSEHMFSLT